MKVLVVDDSTINNMLLQNFLEEHGFEVITALNGYDAIRILESQKPDLLLLDLMMPGLSGFDVLKMLRKENSDLPVIIISAFADADYINLARELGAKDYIKKPINLGRLVQTIQTAV